MILLFVDIEFISGLIYVYEVFSSL